MLERIIIISLITIAVHVCTWEGMILHRPAEWIGRILDDHNLSILRKPAFECVTCMGGIYTLLTYPALYGLDWKIIPTMIAVIGANTLASAVLKYIQQ